MKVSVLQRSAFFMDQLSHQDTTTGKTIDLTIGTFVRKVLSLLFNILCRFVIAFLNFPDSSVGKESACNAGDPSLILGLERSIGEAIGYHSSIPGLPLWLSW